MNPVWKRLEPHRPLDPGDPAYVERPDAGGSRIAEWVRAGKSTVLVVGPVGIGKSTELAQAAKLLQQERVACLVPLDRFENMRRITAEQALLRLASRLLWFAVEHLQLNVSAELRGTLWNRGFLPDELLNGKVNAQVEGSAEAIAIAAVREVARLSQRGRVTLLVDGLEKTPEGPARAVFDALALLADEAELVVVVPWHAAFGPGAQEVIRPDEKLMVLRPLAVEGPAGQPGRWFLVELLAFRDSTFNDRLKIRSGSPSDPFVDLAVQAAEWSGGIPRTFLQLISDAASSAFLRRASTWPKMPDLQNAAADQRDSFRRLLLPGDEEAILAIDGTDGREMELQRKIRLLAHGILLEREEEGRPVMRSHPLVRPLLADGQNRA